VPHALPIGQHAGGHDPLAAACTMPPSPPSPPPRGRLQDPRFIMTLVDSQERQKRLSDEAMRAPDPA
jgi:hypothetical protein